MFPSAVEGMDKLSGRISWLSKMTTMITKATIASIILRRLNMLRGDSQHGKREDKQARRQSTRS